MSGTKRERKPGVWQLIVNGPRDPTTGRYRQITRTVHGGARHADRELSRLVAEVADQKHAGRQGTLNALIDEWIRVADYEPSTLDIVQRDRARYITRTIGARQVRTLKPRDLTVFYAGLMRGGGRDGRSLSAATVRRVHALIRRALGYGVEIEWLPANPAANARLPRDRDRDEISPPSPAQIALLFAAAERDDSDWAMFLRLAAATGARRGEICALRWRAVDLERGTVTISRALGRTAKGAYEKGTKTRQTRTVVLGAATLAQLRAHHSRCAARADTFGTRLDPDGYVFAADPEAERPWDPKHVTNRFIALRDSLGLRCRLHDLRHFVGSYLIDAGVPVTTVAKQLGHDRESTTTDVYGHPLDRGLRVAAETIDGLLDG